VSYFTLRTIIVLMETMKDFYKTLPERRVPRLRVRARRHRVEAPWLALPLRPLTRLAQECELTNAHAFPPGEKGRGAHLMNVRHLDHAAQPSAKTTKGEIHHCRQGADVGRNADVRNCVVRSMEGGGCPLVTMVTLCPSPGASIALARCLAGQNRVPWRSRSVHAIYT
jgi:hypothetical protein